MNIEARREIYKKLETHRSNPLIVYITSQRPGATGLMAGDVINEMIDQIQALPSDAKKVDLLIESNGGDPLTAWRIISLLRSKVTTVNVLIPHSSFSAATILALGADEIVMGKYGSLGPIDPQITSMNKDGTQKQFSYEDIVAFLDFTRKEAGITEQRHFETAFKLLCETVEPSAIGFAHRASSLSTAIGEKLLQMHQKDADQKAQAIAIAKKLNRSFFSHGHALSRTEAKDIGLNITEADATAENLMWQIHESFEKEINARKPFNTLSEFLSDPAAAAYLQNPPALNLPANINPQIIMQMLNNHIQTQLSAATPTVEVKIKHAFVESVRKASENVGIYRILAMRTPDLNFICNLVKIEECWQAVSLPATNP